MRRIARVEWEERREQMFREVCHEFQRSMLAAVNDTELFMHIFERFLQSFESYNVSSRYDAGRLSAEFFRKLLTKERGDEYEVIRNVKKLIQNDLVGDLSVAGLGVLVHVTPNYLSRIFKRQTGEGCNEYIVRKRIEKAKSLLETTLMKTSEIAGMVGYHDINYFSLAFKKQTGMSPTKYREYLAKKW